MVSCDRLASNPEYSQIHTSVPRIGSRIVALTGIKGLLRMEETAQVQVCKACRDLHMKMKTAAFTVLHKGSKYLFKNTLLYFRVQYSTVN